MTYALIVSGAIKSERAAVPPAAQRLDTGAWVTPPGGVWTDAQAALCGWLPVVDKPRPADTATTTTDRSLALVAGKPTVTWTVRDKSAGELAWDIRVAELEALRLDIITKAIVWLEADAASAQARADSVTGAVAEVAVKRGQVQGYTFAGTTVAGINASLNAALKPMLVDMLTYIIGLGDLVAGVEEWRGARADPALVWLARHGTGTTD